MNVYEVERMTVVSIPDAVDDVDAMVKALAKARGNFVPVKPDCRYVAVVPGGARRDLTPEAMKPTKVPSERPA